MPWWDIFDEAHDTGVYLGYHDKTCRYGHVHTYLFPDTSGDTDAWLSKEQAADAPVGLMFFARALSVYQIRGNLRKQVSLLSASTAGIGIKVRSSTANGFLSNFPFDKSGSWLRRQSSWFSSIIYQQRTEIVADYKTYDR